MEDPAVFVLPLENRKKVVSLDKQSKQTDKFRKKEELSEANRSSGNKFAEKDSQKLGELLKRKHDLMARLRKIDNELHNPSLLPVTM